MDLNSGFLVSYSYCEATNECLEDAWNYINRDCPSEWKTGSSYDLGICNPDIITCPPVYVSEEAKYGAYENMTWTLPEGASCVVSVDTTLGVARVIFDETSYLGLEGTDKKLGEVITFEQGSGINTITIYNAAQSGPLTFLISFSGAASITALALGTLTLMGIALWAPTHFVFAISIKLKQNLCQASTAISIVVDSVLFLFKF